MMSLITILTMATFLGSIPTGCEAGCEAMEDFVLPDPADLNITLGTNITSGYNPWMPQYSYLGSDPSKKTFLVMTGGCIPVEDGGSDWSQEIRPSFFKGCDELNMECQCRPIIRGTKWNPPVDYVVHNLYQGLHHCSWEIRRALDEHRRGLINLGGISAKCGLGDAEIFNEARELGVPIFIIQKMPLEPGEDDYGKPEPDGYIGVDHEHLGKSLALVLKQVRPEGGTYGFVMAWSSHSGLRRRRGFNSEMSKDHGNEKKIQWHEVERYPYEHPYNTSIPCQHMTCQMELLASERNTDALIMLFQSPVRNSNFTHWVNSNRFRNLAYIAIDGVNFLDFLVQGYLDGMVGQVAFQMGKRSAEILLDISTKLDSGELTLPLKESFFETSVISYSSVPVNLDKVHPPNLDQNLLGSLRITGVVCFIMIMLMALMCAGWTIYNCSAMIVRSAQPFFLLILLVGIMVLASTIVPLSFDDGGEPDSMSEAFAVGVCMSQPWLAFTGFSAIFSALFSKTWRVNKLFDARQSHARVMVTRMDVLGPFAVIFTCNVIVLVCWTIIDPLTYTRRVGDGTDLWNREIESYGACRSDKSQAFLIPLAVINFMVLGIACWQAFKGRNIESEFAESKYIAFSVASLFQAFLTGFPILVIVKDEPKAFYLVLVLMIFVLCGAILLLIFLPKIFLAYRYSGMTEEEQRKEMSEVIRRSSETSRRQIFSYSSRNQHDTPISADGAGGSSSGFASRGTGEDTPPNAPPQEIALRGRVWSGTDKSSNISSIGERAEKGEGSEILSREFGPPPKEEDEVEVDDE